MGKVLPMKSAKKKRARNRPPKQFELKTLERKKDKKLAKLAEELYDIREQRMAYTEQETEATAKLAVAMRERKVSE